METRKPVEPLLVTHLIADVRNELVNVLGSLSDEEWNRQTVCEGWSVRDVALHILGDDMGLLSNLRDHDGQYHQVESWDGLVALINASNNEWVTATRRISRKLLVDLLRFMGQQVHDLFISIDPYRLGGPVSWAGDDPAPMWLHVARELTEYWTHHQQICDAVGRTSLKEARFIHPVLATFVHALPRTFRTIDAPVDTVVKFIIIGDGGSKWDIVRESSGWKLYAETDLEPASTVSLDTDSAWRLFTKNLSIEQLRPHIVIAGNSRLGEIVLSTVGIIA